MFGFSQLLRIKPLNVFPLYFLILRRIPRHTKEVAGANLHIVQESPVVLGGGLRSPSALPLKTAVMSTKQFIYAARGDSCIRTTDTEKPADNRTWRNLKKERKNYAAKKHATRCSSV